MAINWTSVIVMELKSLSILGELFACGHYKHVKLIIIKWVYFSTFFGYTNGGQVGNHSGEWEQHGHFSSPWGVFHKSKFEPWTSYYQENPCSIRPTYRPSLLQLDQTPRVYYSTLFLSLWSNVLIAYNSSYSWTSIFSIQNYKRRGLFAAFRIYSSPI